MFDWMVWTTPVAVFFSGIALMLAGMTLWELRSPTVLRKGWLPIATTRGSFVPSAMRASKSSPGCTTDDGEMPMLWYTSLSVRRFS